MNLYLRSLPGMCLCVLVVNYTLLQCGAPEWSLHAFAAAFGWLSAHLSCLDERRLKEAA